MDNQVHVLETGNVYFFFRPRVNETTVESVNDVERFYILLEPKDQSDNLFRLLVVGQKMLPEINPRGGGEDYWGFVEKVTDNPYGMRDELVGKTYETKTRGEQTKEPVRPVGEGVYDIVLHEDHTHFVYMLKVPQELGEAQKALHISNQGSYIFSIKNPKLPPAGGGGLPLNEQPQLPENLKDKFDGHNWIKADPPTFLNYQYTQFILIGAEPNIEKELGLNLNPQKEQEQVDALFNDLHINAKSFDTNPLFKGGFN